MRAIPGIVFLAASIFRMKTDVRCILATTQGRKRLTRRSGVGALP